MGVRVGEGLHQAAWSGRSTGRLVALLLIEPGEMRSVQAPNHACAHFTSSLLNAAVGLGDAADLGGELCRALGEEHVQLLDLHA